MAIEELREDAFCNPVIINNGKVRVGRKDLEIKWVKINATSSGDNTILSGVTDKKIRVIVVDFSTDAKITIAWKSASTVVREAQSFAVDGGIGQNCNPGWYVETAAGEDLVMTLSGAANVSGSICYVEV